MKLCREIFNYTFRDTMDSLGVKGKDLAERTGRSVQNISEIRKGKASPTIGDFVEMIAIADEIAPGFFESFVRKLIGESRRLSASPEEYVSSLDSSEFGALMFACASRVNTSREHHQVA